MKSKIVVQWLTALILTATLAATRDAWAWGRGHRLIRSWAVARLPDWQIQLLDDVHWKRLLTDYLSLQDRHAGGNSPELDKYCLVPEIRVSLHDVNPPEPSVNAIIWCLSQISRHLRSGEHDEAMKYLGVLCHWNEDPGSPSAHSCPVSETVLRQLIPPPRNKACFNYVYGYGGIADRGQYTVADEPYRPRLLGASLAEAAARVYQEQRLLQRRASAHIVPIVQDEMYGDGTQADRERAAAALDNAKHVADVVYTVLCLATERVDPNEAARLESQPLSQWLSDFQGGRTSHPYYVVPYLVDQAMDADRKLHPLAFPDEGEKSQVAFGFGMGAPFALEYTIAPGGVFDRFTCRVGLHPSAGPDGRVAFVVAVNGKIVERTEPIPAGAKPLSVTVPLPRTAVVKLTLQTIPAQGSTPNHNLTVWAEPTLHRSTELGI
jgi:hypothetical protein